LAFFDIYLPFVLTFELFLAFLIAHSISGRSRRNPQVQDKGQYPGKQKQLVGYSMKKSNYNVEEILGFSRLPFTCGYLNQKKTHWWLSYMIISHC
jgi:hypothetical protein